MKLEKQLENVEHARLALTEVLDSYTKPKKNPDGYYDRDYWVYSYLLRTISTLFETETEILREMNDIVEKRVREQLEEFHARYNTED